ncbi:hypothetical protein, partial [Staphylococcus hominis]|uniref:hypothetical protein n=1 Tax=Staphylococcus hominis TaxID=1290 RepID=UPI0037039254
SSHSIYYYNHSPTTPFNHNLIIKTFNQPFNSIIQKTHLTPINNLIPSIQKPNPFFQKISPNIYLTAIPDPFIPAIPIIFFSTIF